MRSLVFKYLYSYPQFEFQVNRVSLRSIFCLSLFFNVLHLRLFILAFFQRSHKEKAFASSPVPTRTYSPPPWAYHRFCLKQFASQLCRGFPGSAHLCSLVKKAGSTSQKDEFETHKESIKRENPEARRKLDQIRENQWSLIHETDVEDTESWR